MSKIKVNTRKNGSLKGISYALPKDRPIVIDDAREKKGVGEVLLTCVKYEPKKSRAVVEGIDIKNKDFYKRNLSSLLENEKITFTSQKDFKIFGKEMGAFAGLVSESKKLGSRDRMAIPEEIAIDFMDSVACDDNKKKMIESFTKAYSRYDDPKEVSGINILDTEELGSAVNEEDLEDEEDYDQL